MFVLNPDLPYFLTILSENSKEIQILIINVYVKELIKLSRLLKKLGKSIKNKK